MSAAVLSYEAAEATRTVVVGVEFGVPLKTVSEANQREHHMAKARRVKAHRGTMELAMRAHLGGKRIWTPAIITLTRIAPRLLDSDNAVGAMKACRDGIAAAIGIDDGSPLVEWRYAQARGKAREYAVRVRLEAR